MTSSRQLDDYRNLLVQMEQKAQENFDRWVITVSGGALGVTFAFIKDVIGNDHPIIQPSLLAWAWRCWAFSIFSVLFSFFTSHMALRKAIVQTDEGKIFNENPGGWVDKMTGFLNFFGLLLFTVGVLLAVYFVSLNYGEK